MPDKNTYRINPFSLNASVNKRRNVTYQMGAKGAGGKTDCSGFVCSVLNEQGFNVEGTSESLYTNAPIKLGDLAQYQAGDIIASDNGAYEHDKGRKIGIDHVGIVTEEDGKLYLAESTSSTGGFNKTELPAAIGRMNARGVKVYGARYAYNERPPNTTWQSDTNRKALLTNQQKSLDFFIGKGLSPIHASAIVGNMMQESTAYINPTLTNTTSGAFGSMQWVGPRKIALTEYAKAQDRNINDLETQLDFFYTEVTGSEKAKFQEFLKATDVETAAKYFEKHIERAGEYESKDPNVQARLANRVKNSNQIFQAYTGGFTSSPEGMQYTPMDGYTRNLPYFQYDPQHDLTQKTIQDYQTRIDSLDVEKKQENQQAQLQAAAIQKQQEKAFLEEMIGTLGTTVVERPKSALASGKQQ